jgi:virulence factor Mce-like protein
VRRIALALTLTLIAAAVVLVGTTGSAGSSSTYRIAAIFDTARGLVPGQQVKVAGAVVGRVERVSVAPGPKARVELSVERRFAPFRADARCSILPEGLVSENFVDCVPGSAAGELDRDGAGTPTVPLEQTAVPTSLQDLLDAFSLPVGERVRGLIHELGLATAGRGEDLDALLRRANPALQDTRRVLEIIEGQRTQIARAVGDTDRVLSALARGEDDVRRFVSASADLATTVGERAPALSAAVRDLPPMLDATRPALRALRRTATRVTPVVRDLEAAAPGLRTLTREVPPFVAAGTPAVRSLAAAARTGEPALRAARPVVKTLQKTAGEAVPFARDLDVLLRSTRDNGGFEGILRTFYSIAVSMSAYDDISHVVGLAINVYPQCIADKTIPGCDARYTAPGKGTVPVNNPGCGPRSGATWNPPTTCAAPPARRRGARAPARRPAASTPRPARDRPPPPTPAPAPPPPPPAPPPPRPPRATRPAVDLRPHRSPAGAAPAGR